MRVSFIVVNYNGTRWIDACLASLLGQTRVPDEIVVVDNDSRDDSPDRILSCWPQVRLLRLERNIGFAAGCNRGIEASRGDLVAILNNDIELDSRWLESMLLHCTEPWGFWASRIVYADDPRRIDSAGDGMAVIGAGHKTGHGELAEKHEEEREVFGPCAAAALYRRQLLEETGGFDEDFFLIYEDGDLNMRARLRGHRCLYVPEARVVHHVNASIGSLSSIYVFYGHRNSEYLFWKNMPTPLLLLYLPERLAFDLLSLIYFALRGRGLDFLRAKVDFLRRFRRILGKRKGVQAARVISIGEFRHSLTRNWFRGRL